VQVLQDLFYVLLQLVVVAAIILSFKYYCMFYFKTPLAHIGLAGFS